MSEIPSRADVRKEQAARAAANQEWMRARLGLAQKRAAVARMVPKTQSVAPDAAQREPEFVVLHATPNRAMRRAKSRRGGRRSS